MFSNVSCSSVVTVYKAFFSPLSDNLLYNVSLNDGKHKYEEASHFTRNGVSREGFFFYLK